MITIDRMNFSYGKTEVLRNISLEILKGIYGVIGINGSGKTTLLNLISGLLSPNSGQIKFEGVEKFGKDIAFVGTENYYFSYITAREHLSLFYNPSFDTDLWTEIFKLPPDMFIDNYSTGMKKKLALLTALKRYKTIYILDEPYNGLDMESCYIVNLVLKELKLRGKIIIITSHIIDILKDICDRYYFLSEGEIANTFDAAEFDLLKETIGKVITKKNETLIKKALTSEF